MHFLPLRLEPGSDLRRALESTARHKGHASSFVVSGIGSLSGATLRFAGEETQTILTGPFEIISLAGTISANGAHLHMAVANSIGQVVGGHVCYGNEIRTTAEVLLANLSEWRLGRTFDTNTGFRELTINPVVRDVA